MQKPFAPPPSRLRTRKTFAPVERSLMRCSSAMRCSPWGAEGIWPFVTRSAKHPVPPIRQAACQTTPPRPCHLCKIGPSIGIVANASRTDRIFRHSADPYDLVVSDPIVRLARMVPIADRRCQGNQPGTFGEVIVRLADWRHDFGAASACAAVACCAKAPRNIKDPVVQCLRDEIGECGPELVNSHALSSLVRPWVATV
ncbi:hypothetical protein ACVWWR_008862 [Bradyrhizobium sp. LM3.2]